MKRILFFVSAILIAGAAFADESVLIDFSKLIPDIEADEAAGTLAQNRATIMDFGGSAGANYTDAQKAVMKSSLAIPNWLVRLAQSSQSVVNNNLSYTKVATSKQYFNAETDVLGARIHFPVGNYNSWAKIAPPFDIPAYDFSEVSETGDLTAPETTPNIGTAVSRFENGYGVVKNVGAIKSIQVLVYGLNFPCTLAIIYYDGNGAEHVVSVGDINGDGWLTRTWNNPQYVSEVRNRAIRLYPLYPAYAPYIRFGGFIIQRNAQNAQIVDADLVAYFKEVRIIYDKAQLTEERDIDDESTWNIIQNREADRASIEAERFGQDMVVEYLERQKKAPESSFTDPRTAGQQDQQ
jgi:hypothetical protein